MVIIQESDSLEQVMNIMPFMSRVTIVGYKSDYYMSIIYVTLTYFAYSV